MTKIERLMTALPETADAALIVSPENRLYFTGFESTDGFLAITRSRAVFFVDSRYIEAAERKITDCETALESDAEKQLTDFFTSENVKTVAVESDRMTLMRFSSLCEKIPGVEFLSTDALKDVINTLRAVKSRGELECVKTAQAIAEAAFDNILTFIRPGKTEREIALELDFYMLSHGASAVSFETIAVSGVNSSMPHGVPSNKKIEPGDFITMDFGAVYNGYHSDMTRTVAVGSVSPEQEKVYNTVLAAQEAGLQALKAGISGIEADAAARDVIKQAGYGEYFTHGTGHGVGIEIHEKPNLSPKAPNPLPEGSIVTVEPGIYIAGKYGVRIEDMAYITENGCENLTKCKKELIIL